MIRPASDAGAPDREDIVVTGAAAVGGGTGTLPLERLPAAVRARAMRAERVTQLALAAAALAARDAGLAVEDTPLREDVGVVLGTAFGCFLSNAEHQRRLAGTGPSAVSPRTFAATVSNAATGEIGIALRLAGPALTLTAGLVSGLAAVGQGAALLRRGAARIALAGGADAWGEPLARWIADAGLAAAIEPGDGAAMLVLERRADARARGVRPLACLVYRASGFGPRGGPPPVEGLALVLHAPGAVPSRLPAPRPALRSLGAGLGERGVAGLVAALPDLAEGAAAAALDRCPSGHHAAVVLRREGAS